LVACAAFLGSRTASLPPHAGHMPYGKAKPSLTFAQSAHCHSSCAVAQQRYSSSPSIGWWHFGHFGPTTSGPVAVAPAGTFAAACGSNFATSSAVIGHFLPLVR
jgi:hypothetical protein